MQYIMLPVSVFIKQPDEISQLQPKLVAVNTFTNTRVFDLFNVCTCDLTPTRTSHLETEISKISRWPMDLETGPSKATAGRLPVYGEGRRRYRYCRLSSLIYRM